MHYCYKISEKLVILIDIVKDGFAPASPIHGCNYSISRDGWRYFIPRDRVIEIASWIQKIRRNIPCAIKIWRQSTDMLPTLKFYKFRKLLSRQHSATTYSSGITKSCLLHIHDCSTGLKILKTVHKYHYFQLLLIQTDLGVLIN